MRRPGLGRRPAGVAGLALGLGLAAAGAVPGSARAEGPVAASAPATGFSMDEAVRIALARNRDLIAARLDVDTATTDVIAARLLPNPVATYTLGNLIVGRGNSQSMGLRPGFFDQPVQTVGISQVLDVWAKRSARARAAELGVELRRWLAADAIRTVAHAVRTAFVDLLREQAERALAREVAARYASTTKLSRSRFAAGDISEAELRKVELEATRYDNAVIDADSQWDLARAQLAVLLGLPDATAIPVELGDEAPMPLPATVEGADKLAVDQAAAQLVQLALDRRPDVRAARIDRTRADAERVSARRDAYPDIAVGPTYAHSNFEVSGDNPNVLGFGVTLPLPIFDRNQAARARAEVDVRRAENDELRLTLLVRHEIADAVRRERRSRQLVAIYEGGMLKLADDALRTAERLYHAGASSLLEFLEAQRTYLETRGQYLQTRHELRQASVDVAFVVAEGNFQP